MVRIEDDESEYFNDLLAEKKVKKPKKDIDENNFAFTKETKKALKKQLKTKYGG